MKTNQLPNSNSVKTEIARSSLSKRVLNAKEPFTLSLLDSAGNTLCFSLALTHYALFDIAWVWNKGVAGLSSLQRY